MIAKKANEEAQSGATANTKAALVQGASARASSEARPAPVSALPRSAAGAQAYVGGCLELATQAGTGHAGTGFYVGSRNDEDGRYLVGDVAEVLVYNRALSAAEHGSVVAYLLQKYGLQAPRHCAPPPPPGAQLRINFGYGGYQEARGSGVNGGQHAYIENVLEELDVAGEW
jgi:hypothetical protein